MVRRFVILFMVLIMVISFISTECLAEMRELHLKGIINGNLKIHMILWISGSQVNGEYYYDQYKKTMNLNGNIDNNTIILTESNLPEGITGTFTGQFKNPKEIQGVWKDKNNTKKFNFFLETYEEYISHQPLIGYEKSQGQYIKYIAPYVTQFCINEKIKSENLTNKLLGPLNKLQESELTVFIGSDGHSYNGNWSYFISNTPLIYQIEYLNNNRFIVLYNKKPPSELIGNDNWQIAIIDRDCNRILNKEFHIKMRDEYYIHRLWWDFIKTSLWVSKTGTKAEITISYIMTGKAVSPFQKFRITLDMDDTQIDHCLVEQTKG